MKQLKYLQNNLLKCVRMIHDCVSEDFMFRFTIDLLCEDNWDGIDGVLDGVNNC